MQAGLNKRYRSEENTCGHQNNVSLKWLPVYLGPKNLIFLSLHSPCAWRLFGFVTSRKMLSFTIFHFHFEATPFSTAMHETVTPNLFHRTRCCFVSLPLLREQKRIWLDCSLDFQILENFARRDFAPHPSPSWNLLSTRRSSFRIFSINYGEHSYCWAKWGIGYIRQVNYNIWKFILCVVTWSKLIYPRKQCAEGDQNQTRWTLDLWFAVESSSGFLNSFADWGPSHPVLSLA